MPSLPLTIINTSQRQHRRLFTEISPGHLELCLDNSTMEKFLTCPRSFELYRIYGRDQGNRDALNYGTAIHTALETFYLGGTLGDMIERVMAYFSANPCSENSWHNADHCIEACRRYVKWREMVEKMQGPLDIVKYQDKPAIEVPFKLPLFQQKIPLVKWTDYPDELVIAATNDEPYIGDWIQIDVFWTGKIDLVYRKDSKLRTVDHKTTSIVGPTFQSSFHLSSQMMGYCWATEQLFGERCWGTDIDTVIGRPPTTKGAGIQWDNEWHSYDYQPEQIADWKLDIIAHINTLITYFLSGHYPKSTTYCTNKFGKCPYLDTCMQPDKMTASRILMSGQYAETVWSPIKN